MINVYVIRQREEVNATEMNREHKANTENKKFNNERHLGRPLDCLLEIRN